ncbi:response regulator transcription factor [Sphingomonas sp. MMS12-HWE2-04]|uniref:response regulator transcription factor n=1 Tax=Sphingomonas sp. MMS12-HWE2-04 TaxID=3234199 RepID=UPI00384C4BB4
MDHSNAQAAPGLRRRAISSILAAGEDRAGLAALAQRLGSLGYLVVLAHSGAQALELISARGFDLVVLDARMPQVSGQHVLKEVRSARDTVDLPLLLIVDKGAQDSMIEALANGADDCLMRPFEFAELAVRIERTLIRARRIDALKRANLALDARIAARAIELGETRSELARAHADRNRLLTALQTVHEHLERDHVGSAALDALSDRTSVAG